MAELEIIEVKQGADWEIEIPDVKDKLGVLITPGGVASVKSQVRTFLDPLVTPPNPLHEYSTAAGTIVVSTGKVTLIHTGAVSAAWTWRYARIDVKLVDSAGKKAFVADGFIRLIPEWTLG